MPFLFGMGPVPTIRRLNAREPLADLPAALRVTGAMSAGIETTVTAAVVMPANAGIQSHRAQDGPETSLRGAGPR